MTLLRVNLEGLSLSSLMAPVPLGILCGLFFGKQIGVLFFSYISIKLKFAEAPNNSNLISSSLSKINLP